MDNLQLTQTHLRALGYAPADKIHFRAIGPNGAKKVEGTIEQRFNELQSLNSKGFGIYVVVNGDGHTDADVTAGRAVFYEHDDLPKEVQIDLWKSLGLPQPTIQIDTGGKSIHSYWVFDHPIEITRWRVLQADLLDFADADRSIKNPSRVMRLAGFTHQKSGGESVVVSNPGKRYSFEYLRSMVTVVEPISEPSPKSSPKPSQPASIGMDEIPLVKCIAPRHRDLIASGMSEGGRDNAGIAIAKDLIGTEQHLRSIGQRFDGNARSLHEDYCSRCNPPLTGNDVERIWKSAEKSTNGPCLSEDKIQGCIDAYFKRGRSTAAATPQGNRPALVAIDGGGKVEESSDEAEYQADLETFRESESALQALSAARFSDRPEEFFLGTGKIYEVCGGEVRDNIRNGWLAGSLAIGQVLASLCPRQARILPPCQMTSKQGMLAFIAIEAPKNSGKSVVFESISPFIRGLKRIDASRMIEHKEVRAELKAMADSEEGSPPEFVENPSLSNVPPIVQVGDSTMPALKSVIAASGYWTYAAKFTRRQIRSAGTLIYSREGVSLFESFGQNNQSEQGVKACFSGFWASEQESVLRKTNSELTMPEDSTVGILTACQAGQMRNLIESEIRKKRGAIDVGFALRFASVDLLNTLASKDRKFVPRDYEAELRQAENPVDLHPVMEKFAAAVASAKNTPILCDEQAIVFFSDVWIPWVNNQSWTGWLDGYEAKASANLMRLAWAYRCMDIFDEIASGTSHPDLVITWTAMERAFEVLERSTAKFVYEVALIEKNQTLYEKAREAEKQQSLVRSKYYVTFTDPAMTHHWVSEKRAGGCSSFRLLVQKVKGSTRSELKQHGVDVTAILRPIWDALETASTPIVASKVEPDAFEYAYEETAA